MEAGNYSEFSKVNIWNDFLINFRVADDWLYKEDYTTTLILRKNNIHTLEDLFIAYDNDLFKNGYRKGIKALRGTVELLRFKYLKKPIVSDIILDEKSAKDLYGNNMLPGVVYRNGKEFNDRIERLGFTEIEIELLKEFFRTLPYKEEFTLELVFKIFDKQSDYKLEDGLFVPGKRDEILLKRTIALRNLKTKIAIIKEYLNYLETSDTIDALNARLKRLMHSKNKLNREIHALKEVMSTREYCEIADKSI